MMVVDEVAEYVDLDPALNGADLHPRHDLDTQPLPGLKSFINATDCIVVSDPHSRQAGVRRRLNHLSRRQGPIRSRRMNVKIRKPFHLTHFPTASRPSFA